MVEFLKNNYEWIFSGIGVAAISFVIGLVLRRRSRKERLGGEIVSGKSSTRGDYSPIIVGKNNRISRKTDQENRDT